MAENFGDPVAHRMRSCKALKPKEKRIDCKFKILEDLTDQQDIVNLNIRAEIDNMKDSRWWPIIINNDANAIILHTARRKGRLEHMDPFYIEEKVDNIFARWHNTAKKLTKTILLER